MLILSPCRCRRAHRLTLPLPLQHQSIPGWTAAVLWRRRTPAANANRSVVAIGRHACCQEAGLPTLPAVDGSARVKKLFLSAQLEVAQCFQARSSPEAVVLLAVNPKDETQSIPAQNGAEYLVERRKIQVVGYGQTPMTIGLTLRRTARNISCLKGVGSDIPSAYVAGQTPGLLPHSCRIRGSLVFEHTHRLQAPPARTDSMGKLQSRVAITSRYSASTTVASQRALFCSDQRQTRSCRSSCCSCVPSEAKARAIGP